MERRDFIKSSLSLVAGAAAIPLTATAAATATDTETLTILHTNDVHSRIDPFPETDPKFPGKGGIAKRLTLINQIRSTEKNVLLFDCGDIFQGTPYFNLFGGELEFKAMSKMAYDAATMGNHDFDNGIEGFVKMLPHASFPFICSNYDFTNTLLAGQTQKFKIFQKGNIKVGVIGLGIELKGLVPDKLYGKTEYLDPVETANLYGKLLRKQYKCDLIICLSHLGFKYEEKKISDIELARKTSWIDVIIGGHTHTFLKEPVIEKNAINKKVVINQTGWGGINLGTIKILFGKKKSNEGNYSEISYIAGGNQEIA